MKYGTVLLVINLLFFTAILSAQEEHNAEHGNAHSEDGKHLRHAIGFSIGHTHISTGFQDGDSKWLALPSFGLHYAHSFHSKWALALHSEMIVEDFVVKGSSSKSGEGGENEASVIKRGRPAREITYATDHFQIIISGNCPRRSTEQFRCKKKYCNVMHNFFSPF